MPQFIKLIAALFWSIISIGASIGLSPFISLRIKWTTIQLMDSKVFLKKFNDSKKRRRKTWYVFIVLHSFNRDFCVILQRVEYNVQNEQIGDCVQNAPTHTHTHTRYCWSNCVWCTANLLVKYEKWHRKIKNNKKKRIERNTNKITWKRANPKWTNEYEVGWQTRPKE